MKKLLAMALAMLIAVSLLAVPAVACEDCDLIMPDICYPEYFEQRASVLVSPADMDNVGVILRQLLISHDQLTSQNAHLLNELAFISQYDVVFLNCGANADPAVIRAFVGQGGLVYASDLTMGHIIAPAFPEMGFTYGSYARVVAANILDEGLSVQLGGRRTVNVMIPGGGNIITGWAENAELKIYMDFVHSASGSIPIIAAFEYGAGRVIFTGFHHHAGQTPSDMRRILSYLAFGLYLEDEITAITQIANERGFATLYPMFGSRPLAIDVDDDGNVVMAAASGEWAAGGGGAWEGDVAAMLAPQTQGPSDEIEIAGMVVFDGEGSFSYVEFENFVHTAVEGETFAIFIATGLGDFLVHLTSPDGHIYTNELEGVFTGNPPVFRQQAFSGAIEYTGDEMAVMSLGAEGLIVANAIAGRWEFAVETEDENADMFAVGLALGFDLSAVPEANGITVLLDGAVLEFGVEPIIINDRVLVPFRAIFEALGIYVEWDNDTRTAIGIREGLIVQVPIGSYAPYINSEPIYPELDVPAMIHYGSTLVPIRFIAEASGATVEWDDEARTVIITN